MLYHRTVRGACPAAASSDESGDNVTTAKPRQSLKSQLTDAQTRALGHYQAFLMVPLMAFLLIHIIPGDPVYAMLGSDITPEYHDQV